MPKHPISNEQFLGKLSYSNPFVIPVDEYVDSLTKIRVKCKKCGKMLPGRYKPGYLLKGITLCRDCFPKGAQTEEAVSFERRMSQINRLFSYVCGFAGLDEKCRFRCNVCGATIIDTPKHMLEIDKNGKPVIRCEKCRSEQLNASYKVRPDKGMSLTDFLTKLSDVNPTIKYVSGYTRQSVRCRFECKKCGHQWLATPYSLVRKNRKTGQYQGCNECAKRVKAVQNRLSYDDFMAKLHSVHPDWGCDFSSYVNFHTPMRFWCNKCGEVLDNKLPLNVFRQNAVKCGCDRKRKGRQHNAS